MKTSSQLTKQHTCANNSHINISVRNDNMIYAGVQKDVLKQVLNGELENDFDTIKDELLSLFDAKDIVFENRYQKEDMINQWARRIVRYCTWEQRELQIPQKADFMDPDSPLVIEDEEGNLQNTDIEMYGEPIRVLPDFITRNGHVTTIGKIKTSRVPAKPDEEFQQQEIYALGLLGKKLFPNDRINIEINHLGDVSGPIEYALSDQSYNIDPTTAREILKANHTYGTYKSKTNDRIFDEQMIRDFETQHEEEMRASEIEVTEDCTSCPKFNICNYTEPPIPMELEASVKPISEIHLTEEQQQAVDARNGIYRINAGAGAGKTLVVSWRVKEMLKEGIDPKKILLITFTNAGASEMKARVQNYCAADNIEFDPEDLNMTTFNAFCQKIIDANYEQLGFDRTPTIIPEEIRMDRINTILSRYPRISTWQYKRAGGTFTAPNNALSQAKKLFAVIKENRYTKENCPWHTGNDEFKLKRGVWDDNMNGYVRLTEEDIEYVFQMYEDYNRTIKLENKIEYADQMLLVEELYRQNPNLFEELGFEHIIVDEFQDTDLPQIQLLQHMKDTHAFQSLMCVGDDSQAIFGFRHTSPEYMINFGEYLGDGNAETGYLFNDIYLVENHRSTANIIDFANKINDNSEDKVDKTLIPTKGYASPVCVDGYYTKNQEYKEVARRIKADIDAGKHPYDIAFLAYTKNELLGVASELTKLGIPSILMNPLPYLDNSNCAATKTFFDSYAYKTTQGLMDYINAKEHGTLLAASNEEIQADIMAFEEELDGQIPSRDEFIKYIKDLDPEEKDPCLQDFIESKLEPCQSLDELKDLFRALNLYGKESMYKREGRYDGVCLCTIHSAKGLEWDNVYYSVDSLDKEKFHNSFNTTRYHAEKEELNRMHFVAASRAKEMCACVGKYTIKDKLDDMQLNNTLKLSYSIVDKPLGFRSEMVRITKRQEKDEMKRQKEEKDAKDLNTKRVPKSKKDVSDVFADSFRTKEELEKEQYAVDHLAQQMTIDDFLRAE